MTTSKPIAHWSSRAACGTFNADALFVRGAAQRHAARFCRRCPVQLECLAEALDSRVEYGVWGGLTERQRRGLLRQRPTVTSWRELLEAARYGRPDPYGDEADGELASRPAPARHRRPGSSRVA